MRTRVMCTLLLSVLLVPVGGIAEEVAGVSLTCGAPEDGEQAELSITFRDPESGADFVEAAPVPITAGTNKKYYVTARYHCISERDGSSRGSCDVTTWASSCSAARNEHARDIRSRGDVCKRCVKGQVDNTRKKSGKWEWIHGGPCR